MSTATKLISASGGGDAFKLPEHLALSYQDETSTTERGVHCVYHEDGTLLASNTAGGYGSTTPYTIPSGGYGKVYASTSNVSTAFVYEEVGGTNSGWTQTTNIGYNAYPGLNRQYIWLNETTFMFNLGSREWRIAVDPYSTSTSSLMPNQNGEAVVKTIGAISYKGTLYVAAYTRASTPYKVKLYSFDGTTWTYLQTLDTNHTSTAVGQPVFDYDNMEVYFTSGTTAWKVSLESPYSAATKLTLPNYKIVYNDGLFYGSTPSSNSTLYTSSSIDTAENNWTTVGSWGNPGFSYPDVITTKNRIWMHRGYSAFTRYDYYDIPTDTFGILLNKSYIYDGSTGLGDHMSPVSTAEYGFSISPTY